MIHGYSDQDIVVHFTRFSGAIKLWRHCNSRGYMKFSGLGTNMSLLFAPLGCLL